MPVPVRSRFVTVVVTIVAAFFAVSCLVVAFAPAATASVKSLPVAAVLAAVSLGAWVLLAPRLHGVATFFARHRWLLRVLVALAIVGLFCVEIVIGRAVYERSSGWDVDFTRGASVELARDGHIDQGIANYLGTFPNNLGVVTVLAAALHVFNALGADENDPVVTIVVLNAFLLTASVVVTTLIARKRWGLRGATAAAILSGVLVGLSPWVAVPYSDAMGVLFPVLALGLGYLAYGTTGARRVVALVLGGLALALGTFVKPSALVVGIAAVLVVGVVAIVRKRQRRRLALFGALAIVTIAVASLGLSGIGKALVGSSTAVDAVPFPVEYFGLVGLSVNLDQDPPSWGSYNGHDAKLMDEQNTIEKRKAVARATIVKRLTAMGPLGYVGFLGAKSRWILSDGTFGQDYEGWRGATSGTYMDRVSVPVRAFVRGEHGTIFALGTLLQAAWLALLASIGLRVVPRLRGSIQLFDVVVFVSVAGVMAYTLLGEGRARYLFIFAPIFVLAACGFLAGRSRGQLSDAATPEVAS